MNCINCGKELAPGAKFCPACGTQQTVEQPAQQPEQAAQTAYQEPYTQPVYQEQPYGYDQQQNGYTQQPYGYDQQPNPYGQQPYGYAAQPYAQPPKKGKKKAVLIIVIIAAVLAVAGGVLGVIFGVRSCTKYNNGNPRAAAQAIVNAINSNDSRSLYRLMVAPSAKSKLKLASSAMPGYAKLFFTSDSEPEDEVFAIFDDALRLLHKKADCMITFNVKEESTEDGKTVLTGDLSFGNINVGELSVAFAQEDGSWYFSGVTDQNIDEQKLQSVFGQYLSSGSMYSLGGLGDMIP